MGLLKKIVVVIVLPILSQIVCCHCLPRNHSKYQLKSNGKHINFQNVKSRKNTALLNNLTANNNLEDVRFPNVEYPFDSDLGEYYRFLNDYTVQCRPKEYMRNSSCQVQTNKVETKHKRKFDRFAKAKSQITTSNTGRHSEISFFPEVEYPLSARDVWIPQYKTRLQDVRQSANVKIDRPVERTATKNTIVLNNEPDYKYENLALKSLIKTLNTKKKQVTETPRNIKVPNTSEPCSILGEPISNTPSDMNTDNEPEQFTSKNGSHDDILTTVNTNNNAIDSKVFNPHEESYEILFSNQTSVDNSHVFNSTIESDNNSLLSISGEDKGSLANTDPKILTPVDPDLPSIVVENASKRNLSSPIEKNTECIEITIAPDSNPSTNMFTPLDYYNSFPSIISDTGYSELTGVTTVAPFEYVTSPMYSSGTLTTDNIMLDQSTTTAPNPILTTNAPLSFSSAPTNSHLDNSIVSNDSTQNSLNDDQVNFTKNWSINPKDSYTACQLPEDSDDWVIYVDTEKTFPPRENDYDYTITRDDDILLTRFDDLNCYLGENEIPEISKFSNSTLVSTTEALGDENKKSHQIPNISPVLNATNSVRTITETRNVDKINSLNISGYSCPSPTKNYQSRDIPTNTSIIIPGAHEHMHDSTPNDTENTTQSLDGNEFKSVNFILEYPSQEPISITNDTVDQFLYFDDSSSTFQCEYIDDESTSVTDIPYELVV